MPRQLPPGCGHYWDESDWGDQELVMEKRTNALAYLKEHPTLVDNHLGQYVAYCGGERVVGPLPDEEGLRRSALKILKSSKTIRGKLLCIFEINKDTKDVLIPEAQE